MDTSIHDPPPQQWMLRAAYQRSIGRPHTDEDFKLRWINGRWLPILRGDDHELDICVGLTIDVCCTWAVKYAKMNQADCYFIFHSAGVPVRVIAREGETPIEVERKFWQFFRDKCNSYNNSEVRKLEKELDSARVRVERFTAMLAQAEAKASKEKNAPLYCDTS